MQNAISHTDILIDQSSSIQDIQCKSDLQDFFKKKKNLGSSVSELTLHRYGDKETIPTCMQH
jgi:hypothetical protein